MLQVCGIIRVALVWLTAFTTLIAGAPHLNCVCPDGRVTSFCLSAYPGLSGCCSARPDAAAVRPGQERSCCRPTRTSQRSKGSTTSDRLASPHCQKTLIASSVVATPPAPDGGRTSAGPDAAPFQPRIVAALAGAGLSAQAAPKPPGHAPADLVVSLQRLVI